MFVFIYGVVMFMEVSHWIRKTPSVQFHVNFMFVTNYRYVVFAHDTPWFLSEDFILLLYSFNINNVSTLTDMSILSW
jgi:hypothetical protein